MQDSGEALVLGKMDITRVNPYRYRSGHGEPPVLMAWFAPHRPAAATQFRRRGPAYIERCGIGDDVWRGQKEGRGLDCHKHYSQYLNLWKEISMKQSTSFLNIMQIP